MSQQQEEIFQELKSELNKLIGSMCYETIIFPSIGILMIFNEDIHAPNHYGFFINCIWRIENESERYAAISAGKDSDKTEIQNHLNLLLYQPILAVKLIKDSLFLSLAFENRLSLQIIPFDYELNWMFKKKRSISQPSIT